MNLSPTSELNAPSIEEVIITELTKKSEMWVELRSLLHALTDLAQTLKTVILEKKDVE